MKHKCPKCGQTFKRKYNVTVHIKTAHKQVVQKLVCPICGELASTKTNLIVHVKRTHRGSRLKNGKVDGLRIVTKHIQKTMLKNGRFYKDESDENDSDEDEVFHDDDTDNTSEINIPLAEFARQFNAPVKTETVWIDDKLGQIVQVLFDKITAMVFLKLLIFPFQLHNEGGKYLYTYFIFCFLIF